MKKWTALTVLALLGGGAGLYAVLVIAAKRPAVETSTPRTLWTCSMHPQVIQDRPGNCPICGMKLTPIRPGAPGANGGGAVTIDPVQIQNIGIRVAAAEKGPLTLSLRTVGYLREAEPRQHEISLKVAGWIEKLHANSEGMLLKKGDPLFDLYSPEILVAQEELILAKRALDRLPPGTDPNLRTDGEVLVQTARRKLALWNVPPETIDEVQRAGSGSATVTFRCPANGYVAEKMVVEGAAVQPGMKVLRIVDPSELWVDGQVYESQLTHLQLGQKASVTLQGRASSVEGAVTFVSPQVNPMTRTAVARIAIPNPAMTLKPGMFATVEIQVPISGEAVTIPREAVIDTGVRQIVFIARDGGRFEPRPVRMGLETDGRVQILSGLDAGERVVTSGQFLLDSESRMREAIQKMTSERLLQPPSRTGPRSDAVLKPYLEVARRLAADQPVPATTLDALEQGARALGMELPDMRGQPIAAQRDAFRKVSESIIDLTARHRSSVKLYVLHCPMAHARWIQDSDTIANPYFGSGMLECGEVVSTIEAVAP